jgi:hypothetical protein
MASSDALMMALALVRVNGGVQGNETLPVSTGALPAVAPTGRPN